MKKLFSLILLAALTLVSCGQAEKRSQFFDEYYFFVGIDCGNSTLMKLNVNTGSITPLCSDPLCQHNESCQFYGVNSTSVLTEASDRLYFSRRNSSDYTYEVLGYDPENQSVELVFKSEPTGNLNGQFLGKGSFSIRNGYIWNSYQSPDGTEKLTRIDLKTKKSVELPVSAKIPMSGGYNGKFIYPIGEKGEYLSHGFALGDIDGNISKTYATDKVIQLIDTEQIEDDILLFMCPYELENGKYDYERQTLWSCNLKTGEQKLLHDDYGDVYFLRLGNFIYYLNYVDDPTEVGYDKNQNRTVYNRTGGKLMRLDITTGEEILFMQFDHVFTAINLAQKSGKLIFDYMDTDYEDYETVDDGRGKDWYDYKVTRGWVIIDPSDNSFIDVVNTADIFE